MDLVSQNQPHFQTHQALLVIGMQNDFIQPDGRLPVSTKNGYLDRIQTLIPKFRELNGNVIWVQTLYEGDRIANDSNTGEGDALVVGGLIDGDESSTEGGEEDDVLKELPTERVKSPSKHKQRALDLLKRVSARRKTLPQEVARATAEQDDELFLLNSEKKTPACVPNTHGAQFADVIAMQFELPADMVIKTSNYSAFQGTSLLMTLRAKLVTELYICGCITNVSVLATVIDAARHGVKINVIEDCLGYRKKSRHELALKRMDEFFDAYLVNSTDILARECTTVAEKKPTSSNDSRKGSRDNERVIDEALGRLSLKDADGRPSSRPQSIRSPTKVLTGGQRKLSLVSVAETRKALNSPLSIEQSAAPTDKEFTDNLVRGAIVPGAENGEKEETKLVTKKIRMRSKGTKKKKKKKAEGDAAPEEVEVADGNGEASAATNHGTTEAPTPAAVTTSVPESAKPPPRSEAEPRRGSLLSRAESVLNLREKVTKQQPLKSVASQPALSGKVDTREKEKDRDSWSDRMRQTLSRAPKSESESKNRSSYISTKAPSKAESRPESIAAPIAEMNGTPLQTIDSGAKEVSEAEAEITIESQILTPTTMSATKGKTSKLQSLANLPTLGPGDKIGEGDSSMTHDFFPADMKHPSEPTKPLRDVIFTHLYNEVHWQTMHHQTGAVPRLVCAQGLFGSEGSMPVYRHPSDQSLPLLHFSPKVQVIRKRAEKVVGHPLNHVLIQMYRDGTDYISEHSDKTLDIVRGSSIVNVSFGAQRSMRFRTKKLSTTTATPANENEEKKEAEDKARETQRVPLPHNSLFTLGPATNTSFLHSIQPDKRIPAERSAAELAYNSIRVSLTFRHIGTFLDARGHTIWGQGATAKEQRDAADVINGDEEESEKMVRAFGTENKTSADFDWDKTYGSGFDVLHLSTAPPDLPILFASNNLIETAQARLALWEGKIQHTYIPAPKLDPDFELDRQVVFRDTDAMHTEMSMSSCILMYLDKYYPFDRDDRNKEITANAYPTMLLAAGLLKAWNNRIVPTYMTEFVNLLAQLEDKVENDEGPFIAGKRFSIADCQVWPVIDELVEKWESWDEEMYPGLAEWYKMTWRKKACAKKLREKLPEKKVEADKSEVVNGKGKDEEV